MIRCGTYAYLAKPVHALVLQLAVSARELVYVPLGRFREGRKQRMRYQGGSQLLMCSYIKPDTDTQFAKAKIEMNQHAKSSGRLVLFAVALWLYVFAPVPPRRNH